jgi:hypothetical protein
VSPGLREGHGPRPGHRGASRAQGAKTEEGKNRHLDFAWNVSSDSTEKFEQALKDISEPGCSGFETVSPIIEAFDSEGTLTPLMDKYHIAMKAGYLGTNATDPALEKRTWRKRSAWER